MYSRCAIQFTKLELTKAHTKGWHNLVGYMCTVGARIGYVGYMCTLGHVDTDVTTMNCFAIALT